MGLNIEWTDPTDQDIIDGDIWEDWIVYDEESLIVEIGTKLIEFEKD